MKQMKQMMQLSEFKTLSSPVLPVLPVIRRQVKLFQPLEDSSLDIDHSPVVEKKVKKVKKVKPIVVENVVLVVEEIKSAPIEVEFEAEPVVPVVEEIKSAPIEVEVPIDETAMEAFKRISREERQARLSKFTAEQLVEKKIIACEKNAAYRVNNPDKIKEKDKTYNAENNDARKEKRTKQQRESNAKKSAESAEIIIKVLD